MRDRTELLRHDALLNVKEVSHPVTMSSSRFERAEERYFLATPRSRELYEKAKTVLPHGVGRAGLPFMHYPVFVKRASGQFLYDVDGRQVVDLFNAAGALPLGHAHPAVVEAVRGQAQRGLGFGMSGEDELELALLLQSRIKSMERLRFTASGTEATMYAVRIARAFTGRKLVGRMVGSYHGTHDMMMTGGGAALGGTWMGFTDDPVSAGVLPSVREGVLFLPFNDLETCTKVIEEQADEVATIIIEPFIGTGGGIPAEREFLAGLRGLCDKHGILLTFDEMISIGMAPGGGQAYYDVYPDLTATGKLVGAGMPIGVFGGRADIMALLEPVDNVPPVFHTGTWNGHPLTMVAGAAQLRALDPDAYRYLSHIGEHFRSKVRELASDMGVSLQVTGVCQYSSFHYTDMEVRSPEDAKEADLALARRVHFSLLSQGFMMFGARSNLSTALTEDDIGRFIPALAIAFEEAGAIPGK